LMLALLAFIVRIDRYIRPELKKTMRFIIAVVFSLIMQNYLEYRLAEGEVRWLARTLVSIWGYAVRPIILILFMRIIAPQKRFGWAWALAGVNVAVNATALFSHICFWIDEDNHYQGGPLSHMCLWVSAILLVCWFVMTIQVFEPYKRKETWVPLLVLLLIVGAIMLDNNVGLLAQPISYLTIAVVIGCVTYYIWLHLQFVREHEDALQAEQRIQIMISQIQPHFLYNTLSAIQVMCATEPEKAPRIVEQFSRYLRQNLESLNDANLIPVEKEIEHTRIYAEIEMAMFPNIHVDFEAMDSDFKLPALTIQPLVENAIRHGVRIREDGVVVVTTRRVQEGHEIVIRDNGVGFDTSKTRADGGHIGIANVRERLEKLCGGTLDIESTVGDVTQVMIWIPNAAGDTNENRR
ncbi:MAG: histidine kinase, partial [Clostridia bacterium]|nr:histidine kinase [Clostridia bacterium]